jgi:hypothetical protein
VIEQPVQAAKQSWGQAELQVSRAGSGHRNSVIRIHGVAIVDCGDLAQIKVHAQVWRKHRRQVGGPQLSSGFEGWIQVEGDYQNDRDGFDDNFASCAGRRHEG